MKSEALKLKWENVRGKQYMSTLYSSVWAWIYPALVKSYHYYKF